MLIRFDTSTAPSADALGVGQQITLLHGEVIDKRGELAVAAWGDACVRVSVRYDVENMTISIGEQIADADAIVQLLSAYDTSTLVLEATTLGFAELFALVSGLVELKSGTIEVVYVEPESYTRTHPGGDQFALTETTHGYQPIPRSVVDLGGDDLEAGVFFLGFESERLDRALEEHQMIADKEVKVVFGIPAYHPGWELDAIIPHLPRLQQGSLTVEYCSANDPEAAFECLERTRASLGVGKRMFIAPIGPKPCGIAAAVFASVYPGQAGLLFDHPRRSPRRTDGALLWHRYSVHASSNE
ncbi:hypothetical protein [Caballeronia sp. GAOx1]|uniref:hypothetical protein n=1 Tax=Caballeronia sp. GAOx1 TaxID=2921761 RepID=UPI0020279C6B|nr:hypothetical protein [Caballeronia sp. GAOx1]